MLKVFLDNKYIVNDNSTSDGSQTKYFKDGYWYKKDYFGGEGEVEYLTSILLNNSNLKNDQFVNYEQCIINEYKGCRSKNFLTQSSEFVTFYRLYKSIKGRNLASDILEMSIHDRIKYVVNFVYNQTKLDIREYLANILYLDSIILNEDRHFNNLGVILQNGKFKTAPIFDNGKSLFVGNYSYKNTLSIEENIKRACAKPFSGSYQEQLKYLQSNITLKFNFEKILSELKNLDQKSFYKKILQNRIENQLIIKSRNNLQYNEEIEI